VAALIRSGVPARDAAGGHEPGADEERGSGRAWFVPDPETRASILLDAVPGFGPRSFLELIAAHGTAAAGLEAARRRELSNRLPVSLRRRIEQAARDESRFRQLELPRGCRVIPWSSAEYPSGLRRLARPPMVLFAVGPLALENTRTVTIVGTRAATEYGRRTARRLAAELADEGWRIASGLARGIDAAAHRGALEAGGETLGVPGCGFDHVYPAANRELYQSVSKLGLLLSEHPPPVRPAPGLFPRRNRILAALARAVIVVQAGERSGALITVTRALEIDVEVMAVPGPVDHPASRGVNELIRDGAGVATCAADVLSMLGEEPGAYTGSIRACLPAEAPRTVPPRPVSDGDRRSIILSLLASETMHVDELADRAGLDVSRTLALLGTLALEGRVRPVSGGRYRSVS
jgi:DNA processing protein